MRAAALLVGAVVAVAAAPPAADAAQRNPLRDCGAKKSRTLAASKEARVYLIPSRDTVFACAYRSNRRLEIGAAAECAAPRVSDFRFGDGVLAFVEHSCTLDFGRRGIRVIDLKALRTKRKVTAITASFADDYSTDIESWALKRNGSIAWIGRVFASPTTDNPSALTPRYQVWKAGTGDPAGGTMLDSGDDVEPESLGLSDGGRGPSDVYWRKGATPQSATLR